MRPLTRRAFLRAFAGGLALGCGSAGDRPNRSFGIPGEIVNGSSAERGHLLRSRHVLEEFPAAAEPVLDTAIAGGGVSGLAAAWKLKAAGVDRLCLFELESRTGGTSISGSANGLAFPWGAHYINIPPAEADCIHELLADIGVITGYDASGRPRVNPDHLVKHPRERLFLDGDWEEGLDPFRNAGSKAVEQWREFEDDMLRWTILGGADGRRGFAMPAAYSTADSKVRGLDRISMADYMESRKWTAAPLRWLVDYCCRDDYGCLGRDVSAWAGIHYFACRFYDRRVSEQYPSDTLTWEQGNGYLTEALAGRMLPEERRTLTAVVAIGPAPEGAELACIDLVSGRRYRVRARSVVYAGKLHTAPFVVRELPAGQRLAMSRLRYSPWLVAALHLKKGGGGDLSPDRFAWDNVLYDGPSVGYLDAGHQGPLAQRGRTLVYYLPFASDPEVARHALLNRSHGFWADAVMSDLTAAHPELEDLVERLDLYLWGHAMVRPEPGVMWGNDLELRQLRCGAVSFATCDVSGLPLFEEAVFHGLRAAEECLDLLDIPCESSLKGLTRA